MQVVLCDFSGGPGGIPKETYSGFRFSGGGGGRLDPKYPPLDPRMAKVILLKVLRCFVTNLLQAMMPGRIQDFWKGGSYV